MRDEAFYASERLQGAAGEAASQIVCEADSIKNADPRFISFKVLEDHYNHVLHFSENEIPWLLEITGENGPDCASRVGAQPLSKVAPDPSTFAALAEKALQRERYWRSRSEFVTPTLGDAYRRLADGNAEVRSRLLKASEHLQSAAELLEF